MHTRVRSIVIVKFGRPMRQARSLQDASAEDTEAIPVVRQLDQWRPMPRIRGARNVT